MFSRENLKMFVNDLASEGGFAVEVDDKVLCLLAFGKEGGFVGNLFVCTVAVG